MTQSFYTLNNVNHMCKWHELQASTKGKANIVTNNIFKIWNQCPQPAKNKN